MGKGDVKCRLGNTQLISKPAIRRLGEYGGVKYISGLIYNKSRVVLKVFIKNVIINAVICKEHLKKKTVMAMDVVYILKRQECTFYGFGG